MTEAGPGGEPGRPTPDDALMPTSSGVLPGKALRTQMQAWEDNERGAEPSARHGDADVPNTGSDGRIEPWSSSPMPSGQHRPEARSHRAPRFLVSADGPLVESLGGLQTVRRASLRLIEKGVFIQDIFADPVARAIRLDRPSAASADTMRGSDAAPGTAPGNASGRQLVRVTRSKIVFDQRPLAGRVRVPAGIPSCVPETDAEGEGTGTPQARRSQEGVGDGAQHPEGGRDGGGADLGSILMIGPLVRRTVSDPRKSSDGPTPGEGASTLAASRVGADSAWASVHGPGAVLAHPWVQGAVQGAMAIVILGNCCALCMYRPSEPSASPWNESLFWANVAANAAFTAELLALLVWRGGPLPYLRSPADALDVALVVLGYLPLAIADRDSSAARVVSALQALRILRVLRLGSRIPAMHFILSACTRGLSLIGHVFTLLAFVLLLFSVSSLSDVFQSAFHRHCYDPITLTFEQTNQLPHPLEFGCGGARKCPADFPVCALRADDPKAGPSFDNLGVAMLTTFQMATLAGWSFIMYRVVDGTSWAIVLWFVLLVLMGYYLVINILLGVLEIKLGDIAPTEAAASPAVHVSGTLHSALSLTAGPAKMTKDRMMASASYASAWRPSMEQVEARAVKAASQRASSARASLQFYQTMSQSDLAASRWVPLWLRQAWLQSQVWALGVIDQPWFPVAFLALVIGNVALLAVSHYGMSREYETAIFIGNAVFTALFAAESALKLHGLGAHAFFTDGGNVFDLAIVALSVCDVAVTLSQTGGHSLSILRVVRILRLLRVLRVFKMFRYLDALHRIGNVILTSLGALSAAAVLLCTLLLTFAAAGMRLLGPAGDLGSSTNYGDFLSALRTTFQVMTLENWNDVMHAYIQAEGWWAAAFFVAWVTLGHIVCLTLFVAVILHSFQALLQGPGRSTDPGESRSTKVEHPSYTQGAGVEPVTDSAIAKSVTKRRESAVQPVFRSSPTVSSGAQAPIAPSRNPSRIAPTRATHPSGLSRVSFTDQPRATAASRTMSVQTPAHEAWPCNGDSPDPALGAAKLMEANRHGPTATVTDATDVADATAADTMVAATAATATAATDTDAPRMHPAGPVAESRASPRPRSAHSRSAAASAHGGSSHPPAALPADHDGAALDAAYPAPPSMHLHIDRLASMTLALTRATRLGSFLQPERRDSALDPQRLRSPHAATAHAPPADAPHLATPDADLLPHRHRERTLVALAARVEAPRSASVTVAQVMRARARQPGTASAHTNLHTVERGGPGAAAVDHPRANAGVRARPTASPRPEPGPARLVEPRSMSLAFGAEAQALKLREAVARGHEKGLPRIEEELQRLRRERQRLQEARKAWSKQARFQGASEHNATVVNKRRGLATKDLLSPAEAEAEAFDDGEGSPGPMSGPTASVAELANSCLCLGPHSWVRRACAAIAQSPTFTASIAVVIVGNCVLMALDRPSLSPLSTLYVALRWADCVVTAVFAAEAAIKIIALTLRGYLSSGLNVMDLTVVLTSAVSVAAEAVAPHSPAVRVLRAFRALRPVRLLALSPGMQLVLKSVVQSIAAMSHVTLVLAMFFAIFAIVGVELFGGQFYSCNDASVSTQSECTGAYQDPATGNVLPREWTNAQFNFDNVLQAVLSLFVMSTFDGYSDTLDNLMAARGVGIQPQPGSNHMGLVFFIAFSMVVTITLLNLFVGVVFSSFLQLKANATGVGALSARQHEWVQTIAVLHATGPKVAPRKSKSPFVRWVGRVVLSPWTETFMLVAILANVAVMASATWGMGAARQTLLDRLNMAFTAVYLAELALKLTAYGWVPFFRSRWNVFDVAVVAVSVIDGALTLSLSTGGAQGVLQAIRLLRLLRVLRVVRRVRGLHMLFATLGSSLPALGNVAAVLAVVFFAFAYVAVQAFGLQARGGDLNEHANFEHLGIALVTLLRVATADEWSTLMRDMTHGNGCRGQPRCGSPWAAPFLCAFVVCVSMVLLQLLPSVIIETYELTLKREAWVVTDAAVERFRDRWAALDDGSGYVGTQELEELLVTLGPPLGVPRGAPPHEMLEFVAALHIPVLPGGRVSFQATLFELSRRLCETRLPKGPVRERARGAAQRMLDQGAADPSRSGRQASLLRDSSHATPGVLTRMVSGSRRSRATATSTPERRRVSVDIARMRDFQSRHEIKLEAQALASGSSRGRRWLSHNAVDGARVFPARPAPSGPQVAGRKSKSTAMASVREGASASGKRMASSRVLPI